MLYPICVVQRLGYRERLVWSCAQGYLAEQGGGHQASGDRV